MSTMIELVKRANNLEQMIIDSGGEITDIIAKIEDDLKTDIQNKSEDYYFIIERMKSSEEFFKLEADKYYKASNTLKNTHTRIKDLLKNAMSAIGITEIISGKMRVKLFDSRDRLEIYSESDIPQQYKMIVTTHEIDKEKLRADLEAGVQITGARLVQGKTIRFTPNRKAKC